jgi:peptidoglycan/xylan/chitin deacetylase (PgdA/CDA1 family)
MYHRVLPLTHPDRGIEQPGMYVSPETLDMHLALLKRHFPIVHLDDWLRGAMARESLPSQSCALTFDDGWRDNFEHAYPVLRRHRAPATIFLVSTMIGTRREFWPNRLARTLVRLQPGESLPEPLNTVIAPAMQRARARNAWRLEDLDCAVVLAKQLEEASIEAALGEAEGLSGTAQDARAVLNGEEVHLMAESGLVRFGSHTRTHFRLRGVIPGMVLEQEIAISGAEIGSCVGRPASLFCYPNGDLTAAAVEVVRRGYIGAVTTRKGWYIAGADPFLIPRIGVHEDVSNRPAAFLARISGLV